MLINTNLLISCKENGVKKYFFPQVPVLIISRSNKRYLLEDLRKQTLILQIQKDGYGWEKVFSERMCRHFMEDYGIEVRIADTIMSMALFGTYDGGREKAPAALCRKVISAKNTEGNQIDVWGDGEQTRTFMYIDDCIEEQKDCLILIILMF